MLVIQLSLALCDPMDCSPWGSSVHGLLQARILEWVAIPFSRGSYWLRDWTLVYCITSRLFSVSIHIILVFKMKLSRWRNWSQVKQLTKGQNPRSSIKEKKTKLSLILCIGNSGQRRDIQKIRFLLLKWIEHSHKVLHFSETATYFIPFTSWKQP